MALTAIDDSYRAACRRLAATDALGSRPGLERITSLLHRLDDPQRVPGGLLVGGTNGKGSVCAVAEGICRAAGLRTAMLVKPHLRTVRERICLDGLPVSTEEFAELFAIVFAAADGMDQTHGAATRIELLTAAGMLAARRAGSDMVICEVGMGGRLDSTAVLEANVKVITNVELDHQKYLGPTIRDIAVEKAAIIRSGDDVVTAARGEALDVIAERSVATGAHLRVVGGDVPLHGVTNGLHGVSVVVDDGLQLTSPLCGAVQIANVVTAVTAIRQLAARGLPIDDVAIASGVAGASWAGRLQWIDGTPPLLLDGAHNAAAMAALVSAIPEVIGDRRRCVVFGSMADKSLGPMLASLRALTDSPVFTRVEGDRPAEPGDLARQFGAGAEVAPSLKAALATAERHAGRDGVVVVCGSLALVGAVLTERHGPLP